jgi:hypothetical protein
LSILGLFLVALLTFFPPLISGQISYRKPVVGLIFSMICILGIIAVFLPNKCLKILKIEKKGNFTSNPSKSALHGKSNTLQGHHPTCGKYGSHIFQINGKIVCAACTGLLIGAVLALVGGTIYFFVGWNVSEVNLMVLLGVGGVFFGLFQFNFSSLFRLVMNVVFVLGTLLILICVDALIGSLVFDLFVITLILFWLYTRISLSQWDHEVICSRCDTTNCEVRE